ncbi:unnamed protein product [Hermetia illucens]|uniref:Uncharacterized protein n=1 Tax=Hermetia illucens TaxID=343691 RepID=A0A7R8UN21_HERIL|nr:unnamed protein product [Hermetia illucens]
MAKTEQVTDCSPIPQEAKDALQVRQNPEVGRIPTALPPEEVVLLGTILHELLPLNFELNSKGTVEKAKALPQEYSWEIFGKIPTE